MAVDKHLIEFARCSAALPALRFVESSAVVSASTSTGGGARSAWSPPPGPRPILDLCTGTGDLALAYDRTAGGQTPIVGADFCHQMSRSAGRRRNEGADSRVTSSRPTPSTYRSPAKPSRSFASHFACATSPTPTTASRNGTGLPPGGQVAVLEFSQPTWQPLQRSTVGTFTTCCHASADGSRRCRRRLHVSADERRRVPPRRSARRTHARRRPQRGPSLPAHSRRGYTVCRSKSY